MGDPAVGGAVAGEVVAAVELKVDAVLVVLGSWTHAPQSAGQVEEMGLAASLAALHSDCADRAHTSGSGTPLQVQLPQSAGQMAPSSKLEHSD